MGDRGGGLLKGKRVVITRAAPQSSELLALLNDAGALAINLPLIEIAPLEDYATLDEALRRWREFDWIVFTSVNSVDAVIARFLALELNTHGEAEKPHVACVGEATAEAARSAGFHVTMVPKQHNGKALAAEFSARLVNRSVLLPRSDQADATLPQALTERGARVTEVVAYRNVMPRDIDGKITESLRAGDLDAILFFSPTAVRNFVNLIGRDAAQLLQNRLAVVAIGPTTAAELHGCGMFQIVVAEDTSGKGAIEALDAYFMKPQPAVRVSQK